MARKPTGRKNGRPLAVESEEAVAEALRKCRGLLTLTARELDVSIRTVHNYLDRWPGLREVVAEEREKSLDMGELALFAAVTRGEPWAVKLLLKTLGKDRGYVERTELAAVDAEPVRLKFVHEIVVAKPVEPPPEGPGLLTDGNPEPNGAEGP
jgi:hypothetical protein